MSKNTLKDHNNRKWVIYKEKPEALVDCYHVCTL